MDGRVTRGVLIVFASLTVAGCGLRTPNMQPYVADDDAYVEGLKEANLLNYVKCELRQSVLETFLNQANNPNAPRVEWLRDWGAQVSMKITVDEKSGLAPGLSFNSPYENAISYFRTGGNVTTQQSFSLGLGVSVSSEATRVETVAVYFPFAELVEGQDFSTKGLAATLAVLDCNDVGPATNGGPRPTALGRSTINSELQIRNFFSSKYYIIANPQLLELRSGLPVNGTVSPFETFTYEVKFLVTTSASVTPVWKLVHVVTNAGGNFLSAMRMRTDDLTIVMGKSVVDKDTGRLAPSPAAQAQYQAVINAQQISAQLSQ